MSEAVSERQPSLLQSLIPLILLMALLAMSVYLFADDSSYGPNQSVLLLCACVAGIIGLRNGLRWKDIEEAIVRGISISTNAMFILLAVGALIGTWILCGTVPTMIDYGLKLMSPTWFYPAAALVCAIVGLTIGSSWTVAGTLGVALMGVAQGLGLSPAITAGAVISGAYFGDKMSPLSDTTNLAPAAAGSELFMHIRHMAWTTGPSIVLALILFAVIGVSSPAEATGNADLGALPRAMAQQFSLGWHLLLPLLAVFVLAMMRVPAFPTILIGALLGAIFAVIFQPDVTIARAANSDLSRAEALLAGAWRALSDGYSSPGHGLWLQRSGLRSIHGHRPHRTGLPPRVSAPRAAPGQSLACPGRRRHPDLTAGALEHLRCLYGRHLRCCHLRIRSVRPVQPAQPNCGSGDGLRWIQDPALRTQGGAGQTARTRALTPTLRH